MVSLPIERKRNYAIESFDFIANIVDDPATISVHSDSQIKTINDLIETATTGPGSLTVGTEGVGSSGHIAVTILEEVARIKVTTVPFQGAAPSAAALLGKFIDSSMANLGEAMNLARGNPWRIIGVMSEKRSPEAPDLPTFKEAGLNVVGGSMRGLAAPRCIPAGALTQLGDAVYKCNQDSEYLENAKATFQPLCYVKRDEYVKSLRSLEAQLRTLWISNPWNR